jgi:hypothetical protein
MARLEVPEQEGGQAVKFIANIDGPTVRPNSGAHVVPPHPSWDHGTANTTVTKTSAAKAVKRAKQLQAQWNKAHAKPKPKTKATVKRPAVITPKPVKATPSPVKPTKATTVAKPATVPKPAATAASGGLSLTMIAIVAGGLFLILVLAKRKRR